MLAIPVRGGMRIIAQGADTITVSLVQDEETIAEFGIIGSPLSWGPLVWEEISRWFCWRGIANKFARFRSRMMRSF